MLFAFMDESGHPHPNDSCMRPVLVSVCIRDKDLRSVCTELFKLKRRILNKENNEFEAKASRLLTRSTFRNRPEKKEFVESFFDVCRNLLITIFSVAMERPCKPPPTSLDFLPMQFRHLLYRVNRYIELELYGDYGAVFFDGDGSNYNCLSVRFNNWLYRSRGGQSLTNLVESPFFVDSKLTAGIQIADMVAGVIRIYEEQELFKGVPSDAFLSAIARYYRILKEKTVNLEAPTGGFTWYGFERMPERLHYEPMEAAGEYESEEADRDEQLRLLKPET
jgi:hypothetical protein